jgi:hypothetical protein
LKQNSGIEKMSLKSLFLDWNLKKGAVLLGIVEIILSVVHSIGFTKILIFYDDWVEEVRNSDGGKAALIMEDNKNCWYR